MSIELMTMVFKSRGLSSSEKFVAIALADNAHDDGTEARPSVATIAQKTEISERQVKRILGTLVNKGVIAVQRYEDKAMKYPRWYRFLLTQSGHLAYTEREPETGDTMSPHRGISGDTTSPEQVTNGTSTGDTMSPKPSSEPSKEPSNILSTQNVDISKQQKPFLKEFEQAWSIYPRKDGKQKAYDAFVARVRQNVPFMELLRSTENYASLRRGENPAYTKLGSTFFGPKEHFKDFLDDGPGIAQHEQGREYEQEQDSRTATGRKALDEWANSFFEENE